MHLGLLWVLFEKFGAAFLSVAVFFVYAKFLSTEEMGIAVLILSVTQFLALLLNTFFEDALVQKNSINHRDIDTTFWISNVLSFSVSALTCLGFWIWGQSMPTYPIFLMSLFAVLEIIFTNLGTTYVAQLRRDGKFKTLALRVVLGRVFGSIVGLFCIFAHLGAWSVLAQSVMGMGMQLAILVYAVRKIPGWNIHLPLLKESLHYGSMLALRRLSWDAFVRMTPIAAGITGGPSAAGIVGFSWRIVELLRGSISSGLAGYLLPLLSKGQNDIEKMAKSFINITGITAFFVTPIFLGLYIITPSMMQGIFDDKWLEATPIIQFFTLAALISSYRVAANVSISALGHPGTMLVTDAICSILGIKIMLIFGNNGLWAIGATHILFQICVLPKNFQTISNLIHLSYWKQISPVLLYALPGNLMFILLYTFSFVYAGSPSLSLLIVQMGLGLLLFTIFSVLFHKSDILSWKDNIKKGV